MELLCGETSFATANTVLFLHSRVTSTDGYRARCWGHRDDCVSPRGWGARTHRGRGRAGGRGRPRDAAQGPLRGCRRSSRRKDESAWLWPAAQGRVFCRELRPGQVTQLPGTGPRLRAAWWPLPVRGWSCERPAGVALRPDWLPRCEAFPRAQVRGPCSPLLSGSPPAPGRGRAGRARSRRESALPGRLAGETPGSVRDVCH